MQKLPSLSEIDRRIEHTVKDIEDAKAAGHASMEDQYQEDLKWLVEMRVRKEEELSKLFENGVEV